MALASAGQGNIALVPQFFGTFLFPFTNERITKAFFHRISANMVAVARFARPFKRTVSPRVMNRLVRRNVHEFFRQSYSVRAPITPFFPIAVAFFQA